MFTFLLGSQTSSGSTVKVPQTCGGLSFLPGTFSKKLVRVRVGFQSPGSFLAFPREQLLLVLGSSVPDSSENTL